MANRKNEAVGTFAGMAAGAALGAKLGAGTGLAIGPLGAVGGEIYGFRCGSALLMKIK